MVATQRQDREAAKIAKLLRLHRPNGPKHEIETTPEYWQGLRAGWDMTLDQFARDTGGRPCDPGLAESWLWWLSIGEKNRAILYAGEPKEPDEVIGLGELRDKYCDVASQLVRWREKSVA
jgi:hypothetical protein